MKIFKINEDFEVVCEWVKTRNGFKHTAVLLLNGIERVSAKCCYLNRTWEAYEFQSVLESLLGKAIKEKILTEDEAALFDQKIKNGFRVDAEVAQQKEFGCVAVLADMLGLIAGAKDGGIDKKARNEARAKILRAKMEPMGLIWPEDWDTLDEDTKEARLDAVINQLKN